MEIKVKCHAGARHADAWPHGPFGDLCDACWKKLVPILTKVLGHPPKMLWFTWPYGPPDFHQECCVLHAGHTYCDCAASDASDVEWGDGTYVPGNFAGGS